MGLTSREMLIYEIGLLVGHFKDSYECMKKYQIICKALKASPALAMEVLEDTTVAGKELNNLLNKIANDMKNKNHESKKDWR